MMLTPEESMRVQNCIGADIMMALDDVVREFLSVSVSLLLSLSLSLSLSLVSLGGPYPFQVHTLTAGPRVEVSKPETKK
jgi:hypothetical protein